MSLIETRPGGTASGLPGAMPSAGLSRRTIMLGAFSTASLSGRITPMNAGNPALVALFGEAEKLETEVQAIESASGAHDLDEVPGWCERTDRLCDIKADLYHLRAESLSDLVLFARLLQFPTVSADCVAASDLGFNLADDILRLHGTGALS